MVENLARLGISAGAYDDAEIWEVAAMLGANREPDDEGASPGAAPREVRGDPAMFRADT